MNTDEISARLVAGRKSPVVRISSVPQLAYSYFKPTDPETMAPMEWNLKASSR